MPTSERHVVPPTARQLLDDVRAMLRERFDVDAMLADFGQVAAAERRARGGRFDLREHVRGLVLAQLSNQRPWAPIARAMPSVTAALCDFDPDALEREDPAALVARLRAISAGNRAIHRQMAALAGNVAMLRRIDAEHGLDVFVAHAPPADVARLLSRGKSPYKIRQLGFTLAMEYLRNVGVSAVKPDLHLRRILGPERLALWDGVHEAGLVPLFERLAAEAGVTATELDNLVWAFGARGYGEWCGDEPRCAACRLAASCRHPAAAPDA